MRGVGAVAPDAEVARRAEHLAPDPIGRAVDHDPRIVAAGGARKYRVSHQAGGGLDVGWIDRRRLDLDQQLVRGPRQRTPLDRGRERSRIISLRRQAHAARLDGNRRTVRFLAWLRRHGCSRLPEVTLLARMRATGDVCARRARIEREGDRAAYLA